MKPVDVNTFIGGYPFRDIGEADVASLLRTMARVGIGTAWVSHLPAVFWRDPTLANDVVFAAQDAHRQLKAVLAVHPGLPYWDRALDTAVARGCPAVRADPTFYGIAPAGNEMLALADACATRRLPLISAVRLEDGRQRHPIDQVADLPPWAVRQLVRQVPGLRMIVTHADREFIDQVHFGLTPAEARRILWDICWIWGPPEDHLALLIETVGADRFTFGTGMPLRLPDTTLAKLDLLEAGDAIRQAISFGNLDTFLR